MSPRIISARFYVDKLIEEISSTDDPFRIIERTVSVIYANSEQEAYDKALELDPDEQVSGTGSDKLVRVRFW